MNTSQPPTASSADTNVVVLRGRLARDPVSRELPSGSVLVRYEVTTRVLGEPTATAPVSWVDPPRPPTLAAGDEVVVVGRIHRRFYRAGGATMSATEVVASRVLRPAAARSVERALARAVAAIGREAVTGQ